MADSAYIFSTYYLNNPSSCVTITEWILPVILSAKHCFQAFNYLAWGNTSQDI